MGHYGHALGINVDPTAAAAAETREPVRRADAAGLDVVGIEGHPHVQVDLFAGDVTHGVREAIGAARGS